MGRWNSRNFFWPENCHWKSCSCCCEEIIVVFILRINYRGICKNICNYILRIANTEHFMTLQHLYSVCLAYLTNTLTQFEVIFHQSLMSPAILQLIEKPATWFDLQNKPTSFYMCPENTEIPKHPQRIGSKWVKLEKKIGQSNSPYVL